MTTELVRNAIVALIQSVPDIGIVHDRERYVASAAALKELYLIPGPAPQKLRGWYVSRVSEDRLPGRMGRKVEIRTRWRITGYVGLKDEDGSEYIANNLADAIAARFEVAQTIGGLVHSCSVPDGPIGIQIEVIRPVKFCDVLSHQIQLSLTTTRNTT